MSTPLDNGGWAPDPKPWHTQMAHTLIDMGYVQVSRRFRLLCVAKDDGFHPETDPKTQVTVSIDCFAEFRRLGGKTYGPVASIRLDHFGLGYRLQLGNKEMRRWLNREFAREGL